MVPLGYTGMSRDLGSGFRKVLAREEPLGIHLRKGGGS